jgi:hypothetical protein
MLSLETNETWAWTITVQIGAFVDTFTNTEPSTFGSLEAFVAWANAAARPWPDTVFWRWTWVQDPATGGAKITLWSTDAATLTMSAAATGRWGIASGVGVTFAGTTAASGTWAPGPVGLLSAVLDVPFLGDDGDASATGAVRPGVPGLAGRRPIVSGTCDALQHARLISILRLASNPRRGWVYQRHTATWIDIAIGGYTRQAVNSLWWRVQLEAGGEVL